jgi:hypothetical protein
MEEMVCNALSLTNIFSLNCVLIFMKTFIKARTMNTTIEDIHNVPEPMLRGGNPIESYKEWMDAMAERSSQSTVLLG